MLKHHDDDGKACSGGFFAGEDEDVEFTVLQVGAERRAVGTFLFFDLLFLAFWVLVPFLSLSTIEAKKRDLSDIHRCSTHAELRHYLDEQRLRLEQAADDDDDEYDDDYYWDSVPSRAAKVPPNPQPDCMKLL